VLWNPRLQCAYVIVPLKLDGVLFMCRDCLRGHVEASASSIVDCPFADDDYHCHSQLQEREIKAVRNIPSQQQQQLTSFTILDDLQKCLLALSLWSPFINLDQLLLIIASFLYKSQIPAFSVLYQLAPSALYFDPYRQQRPFSCKF